MLSDGGARDGTRERSIGVLEKEAFVRTHPDYGYGSVASGGADATDAAASKYGLTIDCIRERDFPQLVQPMVSAVEAPLARQREQEEQEQKQHRHEQDQQKQRQHPQQQQQRRQRQRQQQQQQQQTCDLVYLDHAGATLFGVSQLREAMEPLFAGTVHGNPHSQVL